MKLIPITPNHFDLDRNNFDTNLDILGLYFWEDFEINI